MSRRQKRSKTAHAQVEVDQSGRTDVLTVDTVLAFSDGLQSTLLMSSKVKRNCARKLRLGGMRKHLVGIRLFAAGVVLLLEPNLPRLTAVIVDLEYDGWEATIKEHLVRQWRKRHPDWKLPKVEFRKIGKGSAAHDLALSVYRKEREAAQELTEENLLAAC